MAQFVDLQILELESNAAGFRVAFRSLATQISLQLFYFKSLEAYDFVSIFVCRYIHTLLVKFGIYINIYIYIFKVSYAHQSLIYLIKHTVILWKLLQF